MSAPVIAFFNNRVAAGKSTLVYHLAWMYADLGLRVFVADLDPQARLTATYLDDDALESAWGLPPASSLGITAEITLFPASIRLSTLNEGCLHQHLQLLRSHEADITLVNLAPGFESLNRQVLLAADHVIIPLPPDLQSLLTLSVIDEAFRTLPGTVRRMGHILLSPAAKIRPVPDHVRAAIQATMSGPDWFATIREYPGLLSLAREARLPTFHLKPGDGAVASLLKAARNTGKEYRTLAHAIAGRAGLFLPATASTSPISS